MWFRIAEEFYLPMDEVVGFFGPGVIGEGEGAGATAGDKDAEGRPEGVKNSGRAGRACALMSDGRALPTPFRLRALTERYRRAQDEHTTKITGE